jgi:hypothetical protein
LGKKRTYAMFERRENLRTKIRNNEIEKINAKLKKEYENKRKSINQDIIKKYENLRAYPKIILL